MPKPIALCLENLDPQCGPDRFMTCVAVDGGLPGLGIDRQGSIAWRTDRNLATELWVSADEQLILLRPEGGPEVRVSRAGRTLDVPCGKPVVLLNGDVFETVSRAFRVHVHGSAEQVVAPAPYHAAIGRIATTIAIGAVAVSCHKSDERPSAVQDPSSRAVLVETGSPESLVDAGDENVPEAASAQSDDQGSVDAGLTDARPDAAKSKPAPTVPIEIRKHPPAPVRHN